MQLLEVTTPTRSGKFTNTIPILCSEQCREEVEAVGSSDSESGVEFKEQRQREE
jgi:hypothetical protein